MEEGEEVCLTSLFPDNLSDNPENTKQCFQAVGNCTHYTQRMRIINNFKPKSDTGYVGLKNQVSFFMVFYSSRPFVVWVILSPSFRVQRVT